MLLLYGPEIVPNVRTGSSGKRGHQLVLLLFLAACGGSGGSRGALLCDGGGGSCQEDVGAADIPTGTGGRNTTETGTGGAGAGGSAHRDVEGASGGSTGGSAIDVGRDKGDAAGMDGARADANLDAPLDVDAKDGAEIDESQSHDSDVVGIDGVVVGVDGGMDAGRLQSRLEFRLLADREMTAKDAEMLPLDSLVLDSEPLLELDQIAYVRQSDRYYALYPSFDGDALRAKVAARIGSPEDQPRYMLFVNFGLPFIVLADGERVFLGGFLPGGSSFGISGPEIMTDLITKDGFRFTAVMGSLSALNDSRIVKVLTETGKLVP